MKSIGKTLVYLFLFIYLGVALMYSRATDTITLSTYRFFSDKQTILTAAKNSLAHLLLLFAAVFCMLWIDHILAKCIRAFISFSTGDNNRVRISVLLLYRMALVLCVVILLSYQSCVIPDNYRSQKDISDFRNFLMGERFVIHAGGEIDEDVYTNSKEAIDNCYNHGNKISEVDIMMTADDELVLAHDGEAEGTWALGIDSEDPLYLEDFVTQKIYGKYTPLSMNDMADFMRDHGDFYIVTDVKDDNVECCKKISELYPDLIDRIIVQIYHESEYERIKELGFRYIIYTLYRAEDDEITPDTLKKVAVKDDIVGFTFWADWAEGDFLESMLQTEVPLFVHTLNDRISIQDYINAGISGIYTDLTDVEGFRKL